MSRADDLVADPGQDEAVIYEVTATGVAVMTLNGPTDSTTWGGDIATASTRNWIAPSKTRPYGGDRADWVAVSILRGAQLGSMAMSRPVDRGDRRGKLRAWWGIGSRVI